MKSPLFALMAILTLASWEVQSAVAQTPYQTSTFGSRTLGQSLTPGRSTFGGGVQTNLGGSFLYLGQTNATTNFAMPWRYIYPTAVDQVTAASPAVQLASPSQQLAVGTPTATPTNASAPAVQIGAPAQLPPPRYAPASSPEQGVGMMPGTTAGVNWNYTLGRDVSLAASPSAARAEPFRRSPELSNRLTRIAQSRGMLAGGAINVYLSGNVALIQGTLRTGANRTLLANVVGLEPNVSRIDNRLSVAPAGGYSSNAAKNAP
jgi:hypothetical protein